MEAELNTKSFRVIGRPVPQGSGRILKFGDKTVLATKTNALHKWRKTMKETAEHNLPAQPLSGLLDVYYIFYMPKPKTVKRERPNVKPDLDKLVRAVNDALTESKFIEDDSRIVEIHATKLYADDTEPEGVWVSVGQL